MIATDIVIERACIRAGRKLPLSCVALVSLVPHGTLDPCRPFGGSPERVNGPNGLRRASPDGSLVRILVSRPCGVPCVEDLGRHS